MSQPPSNPGQDPQWNPQHPEGNPPQQPVSADPNLAAPGGQQYMGPAGSDGQPYNGPIGPDGQPYNGPIGPDGQPYNGPIGPDGQLYNGPIGPDGQPYNGQAQPHRGTKFGAKQIIPAVLLILLLSVGAFFVWQNIQKEAALAVGNCLSFTGTQDDADHQLEDCDDTSIYSDYVGEVIDGEGECSDPLASSYSTLDKNGEVLQTTCLIPQFFEGQCYLVNAEDSVNDFELVDCGGEKDFRVAKEEGESNAQCEDLQEPISFIAPARTYCLTFEQ